MFCVIWSALLISLYRDRRSNYSEWISADNDRWPINRSTLIQCSSGGLLTFSLNGSTVIRVRVKVRFLLRGSHSFSGPLVTTTSFCDCLPWFPATTYWLKKWWRYACGDIAVEDNMKDATVIVNFQGTYCCLGDVWLSLNTPTVTPTLFIVG